MPFSIQSTVRDLLDNDASKAVLEQQLPGFSAHPQVKMARSMSLSTVAKFSEGLIDDDALRKIDAALKALG